MESRKITTHNFEWSEGNMELLLTMQGDQVDTIHLRHRADDAITKLYSTDDLTDLAKLLNAALAQLKKGVDA
jgi:hypothetical protein